jgi:putative alpha-1,2-mannosidase
VGVRLGGVRVRGGSEEQRQVFYKALYHALLLPRLASDADGSFPRFGGGGIDRAHAFDYYDDFALWDTFRARHPLLVLPRPERVPHFVRSLPAKAEQGASFPTSPAGTATRAP